LLSVTEQTQPSQTPPPTPEPPLPAPEPPADNTGWEMVTIREGMRPEVKIFGQDVHRAR
jgi:hypothetical protein